MKDTEEPAVEIALTDVVLGEVMPEPGAWQPIGAPRFAPRRQLEARPPSAPKRRDERTYATFSASTAYIGPIADPSTGELYFHTSEEDRGFSLSRRGATMRCARPAEAGMRVLIQIDSGERGPIELIGRTCWTRVEYEPGEQGARAVGAIGVEFIGGSASSLDRYESWFDGLCSSIVAPEASG